MGVTEQLARFIVDASLKSMPAPALGIAKGAIMDCLGVSLVGAMAAEGRIMVEFVREVGGKPSATVIGAGLKTSAPWAALANGTMAHAEDYDDVGLGIGGHPTVPLLPAVLAVGEQCKASGADALLAYLVGFEIEGRIGKGMRPTGHYARGWHSTATHGTLGAAAAAAKLLRLDHHQTMMALGIASSSASGMRQNFGTMTKPFHAGNAARGGAVAALLAGKGFTAHAEILEGPLGYMNVMKGDNPPDLAASTAGLGQSFDIMENGVIIKLYPSCGETHAAIEVALAMARKHKIKAEDIAGIDCTITEVMDTVAFYADPKTGLEGKFSNEYCVARTFLDGPPTLEHFTDKAVHEARVKALMKKISRHVDKSTRGLLPITLEVKMKDGRKITEKNTEPIKGYPQAPLSPDELKAKYRDCARVMLAPADIDRSLALIANLENLRDIGELMNVLARKTAP